MRVYIEVAKRAFQQQLAYRTANLAGLATNAFWGALRSFRFLGLFQGRSDYPRWLSGAWTMAAEWQSRRLCSHWAAGWLADWCDDVVLYRQLIGARIRAQMQYRASFLLMALVSMAVTGSDLLAILILFNYFGELAGWRAGEVALLNGLVMVAFGLSEMVAAGFDIFPRAIQQGEFDRVLLRPVGTFVQVLAADFQLRRLGRVIQGGLALALAIAWKSIAWTPFKLLYLLVVLVSGFVMFSALLVLGAVLCFWTVQSIEIVNTVTYGGTEMASYPLPIYHEGLRHFLTFVVPLALISYFPALYLLDRPEMQRLPGWLPATTPLAATVLALIAWLPWQAGVRHYQSTGS
jgi:ABC-2 type transport system permease protein